MVTVVKLIALMIVFSVHFHTLARKDLQECDEDKSAHQRSTPNCCREEQIVKVYWDLLCQRYVLCTGLGVNDIRIDMVCIVIKKDPFDNIQLVRMLLNEAFYCADSNSCGFLKWEMIHSGGYGWKCNTADIILYRKLQAGTVT